jgi:diguanylate cyclase (GGDEF)-like protein
VLNPVIDARGEVTHLIGVVRDITDRYRREQRLERLAYHDSLTGLLNRQAGRERLRQMRDMARDQGRCLCLLMLDSDNLKQINDTHGHSVGDRYLREVAIRLRRSVRTTDLVTRIGGDEFFVAAVTDGDSEAATIAERILSGMKQPWDYHGIRITPSLSIGIAVDPRHSGSLSALIRIADKAMYAAKMSGGGRYVMASVPADRTAQPSAGRPELPET